MIKGASSQSFTHPTKRPIAIQKQTSWQVASWFAFEWQLEQFICLMSSV
jgi:hypothetical protein